MRASWVLLFAAAAALGQGVMTTFAGTDWVFPGDGKPAAQAPLGAVQSIVLDPSDGNPVFVDTQNCLVAKIKSDATLQVIAGNGFCMTTGDGGPAVNAALWVPGAIAFDGQGNLYIGTYTALRKVSKGVITTVVTGLGQPYGLTADSAGNVYFADAVLHTVKKLAPDGTVSLIAGTGAAGYNGDGIPAASAQLNAPLGLALDSAGTLYIADVLNNRVRKVSAGTIGTVSNVTQPASIAFDKAGFMYIGALFHLYTASPPYSNLTEVPGTSGAFRASIGVALDNTGNIYVSDNANFRIKQVSPQGVVTSIAGNGEYRYGGDGIPAVNAPFNLLISLALGPAGDLFFSDYFANRVYRVDSHGTITTFAGNGGNRSITPGPANQSSLNGPRGLVFDPAGNLYIADFGGLKVSSGILSQYSSIPGEINGFAFDIPSGDLYATPYNQKPYIYQVDPAGNAKVYAGTGVVGYSGDNGPAVNAEFGQQILFSGITFDANRNLLISDTGNNRVRRITPQGLITTIAGNGNAGFSGDNGPATAASLNSPTGLTFDHSGNLYIADSGNARIRRVNPSGVIATIAGGGSPDLLGDGKIATAATLGSPYDLAVDSAGNLFIVDAGKARIREVLATPPSIQVSAASIAFSAPSGGAPVRQTLTVTGSISGLDFSLSYTGGGNWLTVDPGPYDSPQQISLTADPGALTPGQYSASITITPAAATPATLTVNVTFNVGPGKDPKLSVDKTELSFTSGQGAPAQSGPVIVFNEGGKVLNYTTTVTTINGGAWLAASTIRTQAFPGNPSTLTVTANPAGLPPGVYTGQVAVLSDAGVANITVIMTVNSNPQAVLLTQTGLSFTAVAAGGVIPPQTVGVVNPGPGEMDWTASATTTSGASWLSVTPGSGSSPGGGVATLIQVSVNASALPPGQYYGTVRVGAPDSSNRSRLLTVFLNVLASGTQVPASVQPPELVFSANPSAGSPGSQILNVYNISAAPRSFRTGRSSGKFNIYPLPENGILDPAQPYRVVVQPVGVFPARTYTGTLTFQFSDGSVQTVKITVISASPAARTSASPAVRTSSPEPDAAPSCVPAAFTVTLNSISDAFRVSAGWPVGLSVNALDNCQNPLQQGSGTVVVQFDDGEDDLPLTGLGNGVWQGTWKPKQQTPQVGLTFTARSGAITGTTAVGGVLASPNDQPQFTLDSVASVFAPPSPVVRAVAPGSFLSIYATSAVPLADFIATASAPYTSDPLANAQVAFDDTPAPVQYASPTQLNVLVPYGINLRTGSQVRVQRGNALSVPVQVDVAESQPSVLQSNGNIYAQDARLGGAAVTQNAPAAANDVLTLYAVGLGATDQTIADGAISPANPLANVSGLSVSIGAQPAHLLFAGLAPGFTGLYQINVQVPAGVTGSVPLTVTVGGQTSPAANLAVQ